LSRWDPQHLHCYNRKRTEIYFKAELTHLDTGIWRTVSRRLTLETLKMAHTFQAKLKPCRYKFQYILWANFC
jgi:hypothetical protein